LRVVLSFVVGVFVDEVVAEADLFLDGGERGLGEFAYFGEHEGVLVGELVGVVAGRGEDAEGLVLGFAAGFYRGEFGGAPGGGRVGGFEIGVRVVVEGFLGGGSS
jgi:hypothetical protein